MTGLDRLGNQVDIGDFVRLLAIQPSILRNLPSDEKADVASMLGQVLNVFDVYDDGLVWVSLSWDRGDGTIELHSIAVDPESIELVRKASTNAVRP
jgi:hypothetical protein